MIDYSQKYAYCDLQIVPAPVSEISSRSECDVFYSVNDSPLHNKKSLPLFTAPMDSVADDNNFGNFENSNITPIVHRNVNLEKRLKLSGLGVWCAYSLAEFEKYFCKENDFPFPTAGKKVYALIDCANGHMSRIFLLAEYAKNFIANYNEKHITDYELVLMSGNIANPETYVKYCQSGIDYVRCSIGTGSMCLTTANTAVGYPNASLISEIKAVRNNMMTKFSEHSRHFTYTKIVADGGIKNYSDAIIALACGADYVMIGGLFASLVESCAELVRTSKENDKIGNVSSYSNDAMSVSFEIYSNDDKNDVLKFKSLLDFHNIEYTEDKYEFSTIGSSSMYTYKFHPHVISIPDIATELLKICHIEKKSHGMSTKEAQLGNLTMQGITDVDKSTLKTSEGKTVTNVCKYTIPQWTENFIAYLKSAMSYTNCRNLKQFNSGKLQLVSKSTGTYITVNK